jgi:predicted acylesterase/phospholipase RssA
VPALCSLYLLLMVLTWALSGATFFFDRYRVPILTLLVLPVLLVGGSSSVYDVRRDGGERVLRPSEIVERRLGTPAPQQQRIVVIAAAGGGIQAAAWTARVLDGLSDAAAARGPDARSAFLRRIAVLSGVSGGSVGIAPFVLTMLPPSAGEVALPPPAGSAFDAASASSLDPVVATWVTIDLLPFRIGLDRGAALQNAWRASWAGRKLPDPPSLASLARAAREGTLPGLMFNATSMTSGERVILGTTTPTEPIATADSLFQAAVIATRDGRRQPEYDASNVVPNLDLATAIRMSATFPLVSPAALCDHCTPEGARQYLVDGGYVDNTGVQSAGEWVQQLLASKDMDRLGVSIVQIVPFSEDPKCAAESQQGALGWLSPSQVAVPLSTLFNVRGPGQTRGALSRLVDLQSRYRGRVCVHSFVFSPCGDRHGFDPPLSWHLTVGERTLVKDAWNQQAQDTAARLVDEVLGDLRCEPASVAPSTNSAQPQ